MNLVTPKAAAEHDLLFNEPASGPEESARKVPHFGNLLSYLLILDLAGNDYKGISTLFSWPYHKLFYLGPVLKTLWTRNAQIS